MYVKPNFKFEIASGEICNHLSGKGSKKEEKRKKKAKVVLSVFILAALEIYVLGGKI